MSVLATQEPTSSTVGPGAESATHTVRVRNRGDTVEEYQLSVLGPLAEFAQLTPEVVRLYPGDEGAATVVFTVPRAIRPPAGPTTFGIRVVPRVHPELSDVVEGSITVIGFTEMRAELHPPVVRGRLSARLAPTVENRGNMPLDVRFVGRDQDDLLLFGTPEAPDSPTRISPGSTGRPVVPVRARRRKFVGRGEQRFPFTVTATPSPEAEAAGAQPVMLSGTWVRKPMVPRWLLILLALAIVAGLVAGSIGYLTSLTSRISLPDLSSIGLGNRGQAPPPPTPGRPPAAPSGQQDQGGGGGGNGGGGSDTVRIQQDGRVLTAGSDEGRNGAPTVVTQQAGSGGGRHQQWTLRRAQGSIVVIQSAAAPDRVLEQSTNTAAGQPVTLGELTGSSVGRNQAWQVRGSGNGRAAIVNVASGDCLTDTGDGRPATATRCSGDGQEWTLGGS